MTGPSGQTVIQTGFREVSWSMRGAWLLQEQVDGCGPHSDPCKPENMHAIFLLAFLCTSIVLIVCAFAFFREDKEEQITPLCPQLVVREADLTLKLPFETEDDNISIVDLADQPICKVAMDWADPFRPGASGVAATVRLQNNLDLTLATVVARNVAVVGQGLALCRAGCEIFGFVEPDGPRRYCVRHRTGVHLLTLIGDFQSLDIEGVNPVGSKVCWFKKIGGECRGRVLQHVDAGLVICSLLATHVHRRLTMATASFTPRLPAPESSTEGQPMAAAEALVGTPPSPSDMSGGSSAAPVFQGSAEGQAEAVNAPQSPRAAEAAEQSIPRPAA